MRSEYFQDFGLPPGEYEIEARLDERGVLRLCFIQTDTLFSLDAVDARILELMLRYAGERAQADEIAAHLDHPKRVRRPDSGENFDPIESVLYVRSLSRQR
jgi:hypothetical protein